MTIHDILDETARNFTTLGIPSPRLDAELLLSFCLDCERLEFYKNPKRRLNEEEEAAFQNLVARRLKWEPVAYITHRKEFWSFVLEVNNSVLIPRPDTEVLVEEALDIIRAGNSPDTNILDIGTGSGAIALALAKEIIGAKITATDISSAALDVAEKNARNLGLNSLIDFRRGNLFEPVDGLYDIIVSNPPYIADEEYEKLPAGVKDYEPQEALRAGIRGTEFYEKIINQAAGHLQENGWLLLEIGATQKGDIYRIANASGRYDNINIRNDYAGRPRVIKMRRKS
jgi:release factor glutamine methyltransferase